MKCPICYCTDNCFLFEVKVDSHLDLYSSSTPFYLDAILCNHCLNSFQNYEHDISSLKLYYSRSSYRGTPHIRLDWLARKSIVAREFINRSGLKRGSAILDIGCADGLMCKYLMSNGYDAWGIDPATAWVNFAKKELRIKNLYAGYYSPKFFDENSFDGIICHHVLEHIWDVESFFRGIRKHLKVGGFIRIQVPSLDARTISDLYHGDHLIAYSTLGLKNVLESLGFEIIECWTSKIYTAPGTGKTAAGEGAVSVLAKQIYKFTEYKIAKLENASYKDKIINRNELMRRIAAKYYMAREYICSRIGIRNYERLLRNIEKRTSSL